MTIKRIASRKTRSAPPTKTQTCLDLLGRKRGATLVELMTATGWQAHSVRGFLFGTVKQRFGRGVISTKDRSGVRRYRLERECETA